MKKYLILGLITSVAPMVADQGNYANQYQGQRQGNYQQNGQVYVQQPTGQNYQQQDGQYYQQDGQQDGQYYQQQGQNYQGDQQPGCRSGYYNQQSGHQHGAQVQNDRNYNGSENYNNQTMPGTDQWTTDEDRKLYSNIRDALTSAFSNKYNNVAFWVNKGNVTLRGTVPSQDDKAAIEKKILGMDGVRNLNNQIVVGGDQNNSGWSQKGSDWDRKGVTGSTGVNSNWSNDNQASATDSDGKIFNSIRDTVARATPNRFDNVSYKVNNGVVTLTGTVASQDDKASIEKQVANTNGVKSVNNQIVVQN